VDQEWDITFLTKQWCIKLLRGARYLCKRGTRGDCLVILP